MTRFVYTNWVQSLDPLIEGAVAFLPSHARGVRDVVERLRSRSATVTFGGRFKSGKSSLVNAALGRPLLPTRDLPETGANCHLTSGPADSAVLVHGDEARPIPCTTESLRAAISLRGGPSAGQRLSRLDRVEIRLADFPGGRFCRWIDPPGMFDRPEMNDRAWASARDADILVWVIRSQQFLDESDVAALAQFVAERGPASLAFVENAYLPQGGDSWAYHQSVIRPVNRDKFRALAPAIGLPPDVASRLVVASASLILERGSGFGREELVGMLRGFAGPDSPRVRVARLQWAALTFRVAAKAAHAEWQEAARRNLERKRQAEAVYQGHAIVRSKLVNVVEKELGDYSENFVKAAEAAGQALLSAITTSSLVRDSTYSENLNKALASKSDELTGDLLRAIDREAGRLGVPLVDRSVRSRLKLRLAPSEVKVNVADLPIRGRGMAGGVVTGAAIGSVIPVVGTFAGGLIGGVLGTFYVATAAVEADVEATRRVIRSAASEAAEEVRNACDEVKRWLADACAPARTLEPLPRADLDRESDLEGFFRALQEAVARADDLARQEGGI